MIAETIPQLQQLTPDQKLTLSDELWREVAGESIDAPDSRLIEKLNRRYEEFAEDPDQGVSADEMKCRFKRNGRA